MKLFICYSKNLKDYIMSQKIRYEVIGINPSTGKTFWAFINDKELRQCLDHWKLKFASKEAYSV